MGLDHEWFAAIKSYDVRLVDSYGTVKRRYGHGKEVLDRLDNTPCEDCGKAVGPGARGLTACRACLGVPDASV